MRDNCPIYRLAQSMIRRQLHRKKNGSFKHFEHNESEFSSAQSFCSFGGGIGKAFSQGLKIFIINHLQCILFLLKLNTFLSQGGIDKYETLKIYLNLKKKTLRKTLYKYHSFIYNQSIYDTNGLGAVIEWTLRPFDSNHLSSSSTVNPYCATLSKAKATIINRQKTNIQKICSLNFFEKKRNKHWNLRL